MYEAQAQKEGPVGPVLDDNHIHFTCCLSYAALDQGGRRVQYVHAAAPTSVGCNVKLFRFYHF